MYSIQWYHRVAGCSQYTSTCPSARYVSVNSVQFPPPKYKLFHSFFIVYAYYLSFISDIPQQPKNVTGVSLNSTAIQLLWTEPHDNNAPITGYVIRYKQPQFLGGGEVNLTFPPESVAVITELHPGFKYAFTVEAFNDVGIGIPSTAAFVSTLDECKD